VYGVNDIEELLDLLGRLPAADLARLRAGIEEVSAQSPDPDVDPLTGLMGRASFRVSAGDALVGAERSAERLQLVRVDIPGLRTYNETYGEEAGDAVLRCVAGALRAVFRRSDLIARVGDDDFVVLFAGSGSAAQFVERITSAFANRSTGLPDVGRPTIAVLRANGYHSVDALLAAGDSAALRSMVDAAYRRTHARLGGRHR